MKWNNSLPILIAVCWLVAGYLFGCTESPPETNAVKEEAQTLISNDTIPDSVVDALVASHKYRVLIEPYERAGVGIVLSYEDQEDTVYDSLLQIKVLENQKYAMRTIMNYYYSIKSSNIYSYDPFRDELVYEFTAD